MKISFVILNYRNSDETITCIESIDKLNIKEKLIVIVDNGSNDGSKEKFGELYTNRSDVVTILLDENIGFSRGNNKGYEYIKNNFNCDFMVITNNDVIFPDIDLEKKLEAIYNENKFMILGPDIFVRETKEHQSPMYLEFPTKKSLIKELEMYKKYQNEPQKWVIRRKFQVLKNKLCSNNFIINKFYSGIKNRKEINYQKKYVNCCIQGACIIYSKDFIKKENKAFAPETFLYCEELLLYLRCKKNNYKIIYDPKIQIWHEDSSTMKKISGNDLEKAKFTLPHHVKALQTLIDNI